VPSLVGTDRLVISHDADPHQIGCCPDSVLQCRG